MPDYKAKIRLADNTLKTISIIASSHDAAIIKAISFLPIKKQEGAVVEDVVRKGGGDGSASKSRDYQK